MAEPKKKAWIDVGPSGGGDTTRSFQPAAAPAGGGKRWVDVGQGTNPGEVPSAAGGVTQFDYKNPLGQQWRELQSNYLDEIKSAEDQVSEGVESLKKATVWGTGVAAFHFALGAGFYLFSPATTAWKTFLGDPFERTTGIKGSSDFINTAAQTAIGFGEVKGAIKLLDMFKDSELADQVMKAASPTSRGPFAARAERGLRYMTSQIAHDTVMVDAELEKFRKTIGHLDRPARLDFIHRMETGAPQLDPHLQAVSDSLRRLLDQRWARINRLGKIESYIVNYFPHIWKDPVKAQAAQGQILRDAQIRAAAKRPLMGDKSFLKQRKFPTVQDGLAWTGPNGEKLELISDNPLDVVALRLRNMDQFYHAQRFFNSVKASGLFKWVRLGKTPPALWKVIEDPAFTTFLPPAESIHYTNYDPKIRAGLEAVAQKLGISIKTPRMDPILAQGAAGYTGRQMKEVIARYGGDEAILMHEIGHQLDFRYRLAEYFGRNPQAWAELRRLALMRAKNVGAISVQHFQYLINPTERIANLFHAYWHSRELLQQVAPTAARMLDDFLAQRPDLKAVTDMVKPSVQITEEEMKERFFGPRLAGHYYAPEQVYHIVSNYLSRSRLGLFNPTTGKLGTFLRATGNALNMTQLHFSLFHLMFTTHDAFYSRMALGLGQLTRLNPKGFVSIGTALAGPALNIKYGGALRAAYRNPLGVPPNTEMGQILRMLITGGGRVQMDEIHKILQGQPVWKKIITGDLFHELGQAWKAGPIKGIMETAKNLFGFAFEPIQEPLMGWWVPRQKLGVFYDMARDFLDKNPTASAAERQIAAIRMWDSVDNRMGQMVYDNLFWNKTQKDIAFLSVRSVGWNLGTFRELGGAVFDAAGNIRHLSRGELNKLQLTPRMGYAAAMTMGHALFGAVLTYLYTGKGPTELMDYFFPPTGKLTKTGAKERVSIPDYVKDVIAFNEAPLQTASNKVHPELAAALQLMVYNRDYYGGVILDPDHPEQWLYDAYVFARRNVAPFSLQSYFKLTQSGTPGQGAALSSFLGYQAAPGYIVDPNSAQAMMERRLSGPRRIRAREDAADFGPPPSQAPSAPAGKQWRDIN